MGAFLEPLVYVMRFGKDAEQYGNDYTGVGTVIKISDTECRIIAFANRFDDPVPAETMLDIGRCLRAAGFSKAHWERMRGGKLEPVTIKLRDS